MRNHRPELLTRLVRDAAVVCLAMAGAALLWLPHRPRMALGVVGGGVLAGLAIWVIRGVVDQVGARDETGEIRRISWAFTLVKFFTRHVILALAAYGMMVRLRLDPVAMIMGVTVVWVAAALESVRSLHLGGRR